MGLRMRTNFQSYYYYNMHKKANFSCSRGSLNNFKTKYHTREADGEENVLNMKNLGVFAKHFSFPI